MRFIVLCRNKWELQDLWDQQFSAGTAFLTTEKPFSQNTYFDLVFRIDKPRGALVMPARVIQSWIGGASRANGMVIELVDVAKYEKKLRQCIENFETEVSSKVMNFSHWLKEKSLISTQAEAQLKTALLILERNRTETYYGVLDLKPESTFLEIKQGYLFLLEKLDGSQESGETGNALSVLHRVYETLKQDPQRKKYDFSKSLVLQRRDEKKSEFLNRCIQYRVYQENLCKNEIAGKAARLYEGALQCLDKGEVAVAVKNIRLALVHSPWNMPMRDKLKQLETQLRQKSYDAQELIQKINIPAHEEKLGEEIKWVG